MRDSAAGPDGSALSEGLGVVARLRLIAAWHTPGGPTPKLKNPDRKKTCEEAAEEIELLRSALVYVAHLCHKQPQYMLPKGVTLIDNDAVEVQLPGGAKVFAQDA